MPQSRINLKELAEHLGLSQTTVSRALNGFPEVSEKTRQRVQNVARALNYAPNPSAASLATGRTRQIGHVISVSQHMMINPHFSDFIAGASEFYDEAGYDMLLRAARPENEETVYRELADRNRVDGVVVHGPLVNDTRIDMLKRLGLPFVVHGRDGPENADASDYSWLDVDNVACFNQATRYLIEMGHTEIGLVNGLENMSFAHRRRAGYEAALRENGLNIDANLMMSADMVEPYGHRATNELLKQNRPPSAILFSSILPAMGGVRALAEHGLKPGADIALITFDDQLSFLQMDGAPDQVPFFTCMRSSIRNAGKRLAEMLVDQINRPAAAPIQERWEAKFVLGTTTPARETKSR